jgi:hypothetical protein
LLKKDARSERLFYFGTVSKYLEQSGLSFSPVASLSNLEIHKVFLRFAASLQTKNPAPSLFSLFLRSSLYLPNGGRADGRTFPRNPFFMPPFGAAGCGNLPLLTYWRSCSVTSLFTFRFLFK